MGRRAGRRFQVHRFAYERAGLGHGPVAEPLQALLAKTVAAQRDLAPRDGRVADGLTELSSKDLSVGASGTTGMH